MNMLPSKRQLQPRQRKKRYCHWCLALITFPSLREAAKPTIQSARASAHHPQERGAVQLAYRSSGLRQIPPSHRAGRNVHSFFPPTKQYLG